MADFNKLKDTIRGAIYPNGRGAISADKHQAALLDMADTMQETAAQVTELSAEIADVDSQFAPYRAYSNIPLTKDSDFGGYSSGGSIAETGTEHSIMQMFKVKKGYVYRITANALTLGFENVDRIFFCKGFPTNGAESESILTIYDLPSEGKFSKEYTAPSDGYIGVAQKYAASFQLMSDIAVYVKDSLIDFETKINSAEKEIGSNALHIAEVEERTQSQIDSINSSLSQYRDSRTLETTGEFYGYSIDGKALESDKAHSTSLVFKVKKGVNYTITANALTLGCEAYDRIFFCKAYPTNEASTESVLTIYDLTNAGVFSKEYTAPSDGYIGVNVIFATYPLLSDVVIKADDALIDFTTGINDATQHIDSIDKQLDIYRAFSTTPMAQDREFGGYSSGGSIAETGMEHSIMQMFKVKKGASYLISANALTLGFENVDRIFFCKGFPTNGAESESILTVYDLPSEGNFSKEYVAPSDGYIGVAQKYAASFQLMSDIAVYGKGELIDFESQINELRYQRGTSDSSYLAIPVPQLAQVNFITTKLPTTKTEDIHAIMEFDDKQGNVIRKNIILNAQGTSSLAAAKKNFAIDIVDANYEDSHSIKFGDWVAQDSFHLKAYMWDGIRVKPMAAYDFWESILKTRGMTKDRAWKRLQLPTDIPIASNAIDGSYLQLDSGAKGHPSGFPIILSVNGEFYGIYCWQLKKHRDNYHQKKSKAEHIHLDGYISNNMLWGVNGNIDWQKWAGKKAESETNANYEGIEVRNPKGLILVDGTEYDADFNTGEFISSSSAKYDSSNEDMVRTAKVRASIEEFSRKVYAASQMSNGAEKKAALAEIFDIDSFIDYIIFSQVTGNQDGYVKNWQWTTYDGIKWAVNAYDLDGIWGWDSWNFFEPFATWGGTGTKPVAMMVDNYKSEIKARYAELRNMGIITLDKIMQPLYNYVKVIGIDYYDKEYEKWEGYGVRDNLWRFESWMAESIRLTDILMDYNS